MSVHLIFIVEAAKEGNADEDEPPKVEFKQVEEKDALYSKK